VANGRLWLTDLISIRYQKMVNLQPLWVEKYSSVKFIRVYHIDHMWPERCVLSGCKYLNVAQLKENIE